MPDSVVAFPSSTRPAKRGGLRVGKLVWIVALNALLWVVGLGAAWLAMKI